MGLNFRRENGCRTGSYDVNDRATFEGTTRERIFDGLVFFNLQIFVDPFSNLAKSKLSPRFLL